MRPIKEESGLVFVVSASDIKRLVKNSFVSQAYRTLKIRIPLKLFEERPDVLDLAVRMHLVVEECIKRLLKEIAGQEEPKLVPEELDCLLAPDRQELTQRIIEEVFPKCGLGKYFMDKAKFSAMRCSTGQFPLTLSLELKTRKTWAERSSST